VDETAFEVWPENLGALRLFIAVMTQWRRDTTTGLPTGLDYNGVQAGFIMMKRRVTRKQFADLQTMETAYISESHRIHRTVKPGSFGL